MNLIQPPPRGGLHRIIRVLSILLIQHALSLGVTSAHARSRLAASDDNTRSPSRPYLKVAVVNSLRFSSPPPPPPDLTSKPSSGAPALLSDETEHALPVTISQPVSPGQPAEATAQTPSTAPSPAAADATPVAPLTSTILPDDTRSPVRAEDFLPFFQFPSSNGDVTIIVPASAATAPTPGQMPLSSATYQQK